MRYQSREYPHFCYNIHNLFQNSKYFVLLLQKGGWLATQSTIPPSPPRGHLCCEMNSMLVMLN